MASEIACTPCEAHSQAQGASVAKPTSFHVVGALEKSFNWHLGCRSHAQRQSVIGQRADWYWFGCGSCRHIDAQQRRVYKRGGPSFLAYALKSAEARGLVVHPAAERFDHHESAQWPQCWEIWRCKECEVLDGFCGRCACGLSVLLWFLKTAPLIHPTTR